MTNVRVIVVDKNDVELGFLPKMEVHEKGILHRAISVFLIDKQGHWILQQRAFNKYHSSGLWTNTSCSHPFPNENTHYAAVRRLNEEMGIECDLSFAFKFLYNEVLANNLIEHELDHIYVGLTEKIPVPNELEVNSWKKMTFSEIHDDVKENPDNYTVWFKLLYQEVNLWIENR